MCGNECGKVGTAECDTCQLAFCDECFASCHTSPAMKKHKRTPIGSTSKTLCVKHQEDLKLYCTKCSKLCCVHCFVDDHKSHESIRAGDFVENAKREFSEGIETLNFVSTQWIESQSTAEKTIVDIHSVRMNNMNNDMKPNESLNFIVD